MTGTKPLVLRVADALRRNRVTPALIAEVRADPAGELAGERVETLAALAEWGERQIAEFRVMEAALDRQIERREAAS